ncbi:unnamed protein product [Schistosoma turkestanicum]|nr:unnamed protein product [Schistosoma turkestanicum]
MINRLGATLIFAAMPILRRKHGWSIRISYYYKQWYQFNRQRNSHGVVLREQDIVCMHSPLLRLRDHERQMEHLRAQSELVGTHMTNYLRDIDADQKRVDQELSLIDQLQHESQSQLDQLINRVKRWSSRYEHEPNIDSSISNSRMSSSLKSSTISDNWTGGGGNHQMYQTTDVRSPQSIIRETSRLSSSIRSESIPRPVLDAITQIGVTTKTIGTQISNLYDLTTDNDGRGEIDLRRSNRQFMPTIMPERKQVRNAITQIGVSKADASTQDDYPRSSPKRLVKEVLCQIGQVTTNTSCQTLEPYKPQKMHKTSNLDAIVQSGVVTKNNSTQSEYITETFVKMNQLELQKAARKYNVLDAICQIGQVTQTTGTQINIRDSERNKKNFGIQVEMNAPWQNPVKTTEAACQIGRVTMNANTETSPMIISKENNARQDVKKTDITCQIGQVQRTTATQTVVTEKYIKPTSDVVCQVGSVMASAAMQIDEPRKTPVLLAGTQSARTSTHNKDIQADMGFRMEPTFVPKAVSDVICQVGQVKNEVSTQSVEYTTGRPACKETGVDPIHAWEKKIANDVVTQTGVVHTSKTTQAELIQEQPVYVKAIETQDVPITSYKQTIDAYQQVDLVKHMWRKPTSDVVCQVGSVMASAAMQIDEPRKTPVLLAGTQSARTSTHNKDIQADMGFRMEPTFVPKAVNDVICQVGQVKNEVSTQSVEYTTGRPACKETGVDPIHTWEKKIANDVVTQTGVVHTSKTTQAELIQEQPVYVKAIETQDVPITSYKQTIDAYQQVDLVKHMWRKPTSDVVCQVGSVMASAAMQIDEPRKTPVLLAGTQSARTSTHNKDIQADMGFRMEPTFVPKAVNDVICQVGQVKNEVSTQSVEYTTGRPACKETGVDPIHAWEKKIANDVVTQTGVVHTSKTTQAELIQEQPVYVKAIETQDVPITSYKQTIDAYQQVDLVKHMWRKPTSDVVCQVGSVMASAAMQIDEPRKTPVLLAGTQSARTSTHNKDIQADMGFRMEPTFVPKAVNDVICQVGQVKNEVSTQSVEYTTGRPACKETGVDPIHTWEKKIANDVVTQTGVIHTSKTTQAELIQEQPVYVKAIETQDVPITSYKQTIDAYQQVDLVKHMWRKPTSDVVCQVGSVMASAAMQIDEPRKTPVLLAGTQSARTSTHNKDIQADMGFRMEPTFVPKAVNDVICQVGQVKNEVSTQSVEYTTGRPACKETGVDPIHTWEKKIANDVVTQTGVVHTSKTTQAELIQEQPVYVKAIETQDVPVSVYKKTSDKGDQTESIRRPLADVVCQVGSVFEDGGSQTDAEYRKQSFAVGTKNISVSHKESGTQFQKDTLSFTVQADLIGKTMKRSVSCFDLVTQCGVVSDTKGSQTIELMEKIQRPVVRPQLDVVTQAGVIMKTEGTMTRTEVVEWIPPIVSVGTDPRPEVTSRDVGSYQAPPVIERQSRQVQAEIKPTFRHTDMQTEARTKETVISTGMVKAVEVTTQSATEKTDKDVQTFITCKSKEIQTMDSSPESEVKMRSQQTSARLQRRNYDVQTQSGTISMSQAFQTKLDYKPTTEKRSTAMQHDVDLGVVQTTHLAPQTQETPTQTERPRLKDQQSFTSFKLKTFDVQTQFGSIQTSQAAQTYIEQRPVIEMKEVSTVHEKRPETTVHKKLQAIVQPPTINTETQTIEERPPPIVQPARTFDVQTQSGSITMNSETQTPQERKPVIEMKEVSTVYEKRPEPTVHKKLQAIVQPPTINTETQTTEKRPPITIDVQTQSGSITMNSETQTPQERKPVIEMKEVSTVHEKRPEPTVHKQLQAIVQSPTINTETQTIEERPPPLVQPARTFDVQTQSGSITMNSETQTPQERKPVIEMKEVSTVYEKRPETTVHKKLQAIVQPPTINTETQTIEERPPPIVQPARTFDVQTQSGSITMNSETQTPQERKPVIEMKEVSTVHEKRPEPTVHKKLQAIVQPPTINTETQTIEERPPPLVQPARTFDVQTQSGSITMNSETQTPQERKPVIEMKEVSTVYEKRPEPTVHKKLQAIVQPPTINTETQTTEKRPPITIDVQTQSGSITMNSETQTPQERKPVIEMKEVSTVHEKRPEPTVHKKLQAIVQPPTINTETQTTEKRPPITIDVQTQSGSITMNSETQTPQERKPVIEMKEVSTVHEKRPEPTVHKKLQAIVQPPTINTETQTIEERPPPLVQPARTFDVQTQSGSITMNSETQTPQERKPVIEMKEVSTVHEKRPETTVHKKLQAIVQPPTINTETQTIEERPPPIVQPARTFDVQTQSGSITINSETQTPQERKPVIEMKEVSTVHEKRPETTVHKKLQAIVQPPTINTETQTTEKRQPITIDVQTQSGFAKCDSETQTLHEPHAVPVIKDVSVRHESHHVQTVNKKLQAMVSLPSDDVCLQTDELTVHTVKPITQAVYRAPEVEHKQTQAEFMKTAVKAYDIQTQSGTVVSTQSTQTILEERPLVHTADVGVIHSEKSPSLVNKKLQVTMRQSVDNTSMQTDPMVQIPVVVPKTTFDVVTQSGTIFCAQAVQTVPEERPILHTADVSVIHSEKSPSVLHRNVQATVRQSLENSSTQTDPMVQIPVVVPKTTFDVVTQSGTIFCAQAVQTVPEERPIITHCGLSV